VIGYGVLLDRTTAIASVVLEPSAGGVERVANRDVRILMRVVHAAIAADDNLRSGNGEIDVDLEDVALLVPSIAALDNHPAGGDPLEEPVELFGALANSRFERGRRIHVTEGDLEWRTHGLSPVIDNHNIG
jgi:hypothetical protein